MARPRTFEEDQVLDAACEAFRANGYERTSTRDLVRLTGLNQPSLYAAFGDKRSLFRRALDHYLEGSLRERIERLETSHTAAQAISAYFAEIVEGTVCDTGRRGCLLVNSALESTPDDPDLQQAIRAELKVLRDFFRRCLQAAQRRGEIQRLATPLAGSAQLLSILLGLRVLARINPDRALLRAAAATTLTQLGLPALPATSVSGVA